MQRDQLFDPNTRAARFRAGLWPAWIALACALGLTLLAWRYTEQDLQAQQRREFDAEVSQLRADLKASLTGYTQTLRAAAALFSANDAVTRKDWHDFVTGLKVERDYPAIQALAFARSVGAADLPALVAEMRRSGLPDFAVRPPGIRERYAVNVYTEPDDGHNHPALGYDMWQDAGRRETMQRARDAGEPMITRKLTLKIDEQANPVPAFIMYLPVMSKSGAEVYGYVLSPFRMPHLMAQLLQRNPRAVSLSIHDGTDQRPENLFYSSAEADRAASAKFVHSETLVVGGRPWTLNYASLPALEGSGYMTRSTQVLAGGVLTSLLLFTIAWSLATTRDRALSLARDMTRSLRESEDRFRVLVEQAPDAIVVYDVDLGHFVDANAQAEKLFGCSREELLAGGVERFYAPGLHGGKTAAQVVQEMLERAMAGDQVVFDRTIRNGQGQLVRCEIRLVRLPAIGHRLIRGSFIDITERKRAEADLRVAAITFESQEGVIITDAATVILRVNRAFTEVTGYSSADAVGKTPRLLHSGRHDAAFFAAMWEGLEQRGTWRGEIWNRRKSGEIYPGWINITAVKGGRGTVTHYVATLADITLRKAAEDEIRHLAFYDPLTGLPNRRLMLERLRQALTSSARHGRHGALMLFDLDDFKTLNDTLGHDIGDQFLIEVASRLASSIRECDTVARLGGDEFVIILEDLDAEALAAMQAESVAVKIQAMLNEPYLLDLSLSGGEHNTRSYHCTSSIGITLFRDHSLSVDELMKRADTAMYQAKALGRNTLRFFDPAMQAAVTAHAALENDLRKAIAERQFLVHYQAQVDFSGQVIGAEALVRWQHPLRGLVHPTEFIPLAEDTGLIQTLGHWVLETACRQLAAWAARPETRHLTLAVNVSAQEFRRKDFVEEVLETIRSTGANPQRLKLELTESQLVHNVQEIIDKMLLLKAVGVGFSLDDFGTGYSSLAYLKRMPLDQLKIDQSFVRDVLLDSNDAAIARTVVALAHSLGLGVIAEGVESALQRDFLADSGCHAYQGFFFSQPLPLEEFEHFARQA
ncbi:MAG: EAL domain-containing protein [Sulfuritalea sp.]|nr:EAL domain-containing protein [Sulfuritalea sp.]